MTDPTSHSDSSGKALDPTADAALDRVVAWLGPDARVGVLSGAGISAASGVPTFRGKDGLWKNVRPEDLATPGAFDADPTAVWEWYGWRRDRIREARPNAAHAALVDLSRRVRSLSITTQNIDGLHALAAGDAAIPSVELHGNLWRMRCTACGHEAEDRRAGPPPGELPRCACDGLLRPAVVWFGEALAEEDLAAAADVATTADVYLVVGTSALVHPAASFAHVAAHAGAKVVELNLEATDISDRLDATVHGPVETVLPELVRRVDAARGTEPA